MTSTTINRPGFSFGRVWAYAEYYYPRLKKEMLIYTGISLFCALITLIPAHEDIQVAVFVGVWTILPILFYCGPLIFAVGPDSRIIERLMPVSAAERLTFYYIYSLVVIPLTVYLFPILANIIYLHTPALQTPKALLLFDTKFASWGAVWWINITGAIFISQACLFGVEYSQRNRMLMGIVAVVVANVIIGILGGIIGIVAAIKGFSQGFMDGMNGNMSNEQIQQCSEEIVQTVMTELNTTHPLTLAILGVIAVLVAVTGVWTYRTLKRKNL